MDQLGLAAGFMLKALPLALILFVAFPRIQGSLWGMRRSMQAFSGFSESISPGTVTSLVRNNDVTFRVEFENQIPGPEHLYWRGLVFWRFDGRAWHRGDGSVNLRLPFSGKNSVAYTITLEPHNQHWLFALDLPYEFEPNAVMLSDYTLFSRWTVRERFQYRLKSYTNYNTGPIRPWEAAALQSSRHKNLAAVALAHRWRAESADPLLIVNTALEYLRTNDFSYTLNPPPLGEDSIDDFLFRTRRGYCEHYASAFAFLMRASGIPARLVAGYLGGELNPYGQYLIVRQSDAHVWVELWLPGRGWVRIDPTLAVAPQRVEQGLAAALPPQERSLLGSLSALGPLTKYWINLRFGWDAINTQWNRWVLGYSTNRQKTLLAKFGIMAGTRKGLAAAIVLAAAVMGLISLFYFLNIAGKTAPKQDSVQKAYLTFCAKLARVGLVRKPSQGPKDYASMVTALRPDLKTGVLDIINLYIRLRYGGSETRDAGERLKTMVKNFKPGNGSHPKKTSL